jgi:hypothetical protein
MQARSIAFRCIPAIDTIATSAQQEATTSATPCASYHFGSEERTARAFIARKPARSRFDVKRETGAYQFDTLYKLWMPKARHISIDVHGGYTYFERYTPGRAASSGGQHSPGMVCGISLGKIYRSAYRRDSRKCLQQSGYVRLNLDAISYAGLTSSASRNENGAKPRGSNLEQLSARIYVDGKINCRFKHMSVATQCLVGFNSDIKLATPFFVGLGLGLRLL